jgi:Ca2+-transporting ATPase
MPLYYRMSAGETLKKLISNSGSGLPEVEAEIRLEEHGFNELVEKDKSSVFRMLLEQFKNLLVIILIIAAVVSFSLGETGDSIVIMIVVLVNAVIGFTQEYKAEKAIHALKKMMAPTAKVIRDGEVKRIQARLLVPGDVLLVEAGDGIPADARIIESMNLKVDEAALTGESVPEGKHTDAIRHKMVVGDRKNMLFAGTNAVYGHGKAVVVATGMDTEFGRIAELTQETRDEPSPLQEELAVVGKYVGIGTLVVCAILFLVGFLFSGISFIVMFLTAVSLAVAAVPEGLPATITIALAMGVQRMVRRNSIIRKLSAVETLGCTSVICSDKTGTLTQNKMEVTRVEPSDEQGMFKCAALCNDAVIQRNGEIIGDTTEGAILAAASKAGYEKKALERDFPRIADIPFDSTRKMMSTIHDIDGKKRLAYIKGAPEIVLGRCTHILKQGEVVKLGPSERKRITKSYRGMAEDALRVLAFARRDVSEVKTYSTESVEGDLVFLGLMGMIDPPRPEIKPAIEKCRKAGIKVVMVTGDYEITAKAIANKIGLAADRVINGLELEKLSDSELRKALEKENAIFARVSPEHKLRIVSALQGMGHVVAVTGDGVNDAPALKRADIGVAMGITGTDVSKGASDMILTDDNFASIVAAIEEGRSVYDNMKKFFIYLLSCNAGEVLTVFLGMAVIAPLFFGARGEHLLPLLAVQILWVNLASDVLPAVALGIDPAAEDIMKRKPRDLKMKLINRNFAVRMLLLGFFVSLVCLSVFAWQLSLGAPLEKARTLVFAVLVFIQLVNVFNCRSSRNSALRDVFSNKYLLGGIFISFLLQIAVLTIPFLQDMFHTVPLSAWEWAIVTSLSLSILVFEEIRKFLARRFTKPAPEDY